MGIYPFSYARYGDVERVMTNLTSYDRDKWAAAWSSAAKPYEEKAIEVEVAGDTQSAKDNYLIAYQYYRLARFPTINSEGKRQAYRKSQEMLLKAARYFDVPLNGWKSPLNLKATKETISSLICDCQKSELSRFLCFSVGAESTDTKKSS
jgi:hypothetical protein